jgi:tetratricopeptide (TPR) repeat protein
MKTFSVLILFALSEIAAPAAQHHRQARRWMEEAKQTTNPVRLLYLAINIEDSLDKALQLDPDNVDIRLDLVRFYTVTPRIAGGGVDDARAQAAEIARRDVALGHFALGYIAYREKEYGTARRELREAVRTAREPSTRTLALQWLGWLSQESQQFDEAFAVFEELRVSYEIGRTAVFCSCRLDRGKAALLEHVRANPRDAAGHLQLALVHEKLGELTAARREIAMAWRLDRKLAGVKEARNRLARDHR